MKLYESILNRLEKNCPVALVRIVHLAGSAPRSVGAACIVTQKGRMLGTIGGGVLEFQVHKAACRTLETGESILFQLEMNGRDADDTQMICGGDIAVYIEPLTPDNPETLAVFRLLAKIEKQGSGGGSITRVAAGTPAEETGQRIAIMRNASMEGTLSAPDYLCKAVHRGKPRMETEALSDHPLYFVEPIQTPDQVILFGGGHISTCLAPLLKTVGFTVTVVDDRREYANSTRFPQADQIHAAPFQEILPLLQITGSTYMVIVTRGHAHDKEVLAQSLTLPAAYIGMIGSERKRDTIYDALKAEGFLPEQLKMVNCPIGIDILSETPEEIAVSIVAELIHARAKKRSSE